MGLNGEAGNVTTIYYNLLQVACRQPVSGEITSVLYIIQEVSIFNTNNTNIVNWCDHSIFNNISM